MVSSKTRSTGRGEPPSISTVEHERPPNQVSLRAVSSGVHSADPSNTESGNGSHFPSPPCISVEDAGVPADRSPHFATCERHNTHPNHEGSELPHSQAFAVTMVSLSAKSESTVVYYPARARQ